MIPAAAALATLAREAAGDVFDATTADCSEPMRLERVRNNMPKYTTELVPTMPLPHAAPAPAAEAGDIAAWVARATAIEIERADAEARAASAEAERDRLSAENARLARQAAIERDAAKAAEAELAVLRGAMPDPWMLDEAAEIANAHAQCGPNPPSRGRLVLASDLRRAAAAIAATMGEVIHDDPAASHAAALATATPTPPAAEAGTGGGGVTKKHVDELVRASQDGVPALDALAMNALRDGDVDRHRELTRRAAVLRNAIGVFIEPPGWRNPMSEAERDRLSAELAALRGAMPDPALLDYAAGQLSVASRNVHIASSTADQYRDTEGVLARAAARIRALATATPTPPAAEAVPAGDLLREAASLLDALAPVAGRDRNEAEDLIGRIAARLGHSAAALDTPQEADHAR